MCHDLLHPLTEEKRTGSGDPPIGLTTRSCGGRNETSHEPIDHGTAQFELAGCHLNFRSTDLRRHSQGADHTLSFHGD